MIDEEQIIDQTKKWITDVVIGCNFCPFAAKEIKQNSVHYRVLQNADLNNCLQALIQECEILNTNDGIATTLLILKDGFEVFDDYLDLVSIAEKLLKKEGYEGIYQVAGFHPLYMFEGTAADDAANYTNRSPYPMLHLLREDMIESALERYQNPDEIPERNIRFAREKGETYMRKLREACIKSG